MKYDRAKLTSDSKPSSCVMPDDLEKTCKKNDDYKQTDLSHGIWSSSHLGEIEYELNDGKRTTLANLFNPDSES